MKRLRGGGKTRGDLGMLFHAVEFLAEVSAEIVELGGGDFVFGADRHGEFPAVVADGAVLDDGRQRAAAEIMEMRVRASVRRAAEERPEVAAVNRAISGCRRAGEMRDRGEQVEVRRDGIGATGRGDFPGPAENRGHAHAAFPRRALAVAERTGRPAVDAILEPRAVVAREDDEGALIEPEPLQLRHDLADAPVDLHHHVAVEPALRFAGEFFRHEERHVRHVVREVEEERLFLLRGDERQRGLGVARGELALIGIRLDDLVVAHEREVVRETAAGRIRTTLAREAGIGGALARGAHEGVLVLAHGHVGMVAPHVVGERQAEPRVEALAHGQQLGRIAEVPFANHHRGVADALEDLGDRDLVGIEAEIGIGRGVARVVHARRIATGHQLRARGAAERRGVETREPNPLGREAVDVRRLNGGRTVAAEIAVALVVGEDDDDVGLGRCGGGEGNAENDEANEVKK